MDLGSRHSSACLVLMNWLHLLTWTSSGRYIPIPLHLTPLQSVTWHLLTRVDEVICIDKCILGHVSRIMTWPLLRMWTNSNKSISISLYLSTTWSNWHECGRQQYNHEKINKVTIFWWHMVPGWTVAEWYSLCAPVKQLTSGLMAASNNMVNTDQWQQYDQLTCAEQTQPSHLDWQMRSMRVTSPVVIISIRWFTF